MKVRLSYSPEKRIVPVLDEAVVVKAYQVIAWVSLTAKKNDEFGAKAIRFPAILDTGTTHHFAITVAHLQRWAGLNPDDVFRIGSIRLEDERASLVRAALWLHMDDGVMPLETSEGIAVFGNDWPRLPVLGLRALSANKLQTFIYGDSMQVLMRTPPPWYWPF